MAVVVNVTDGKGGSGGGGGGGGGGGCGTGMDIVADGGDDGVPTTTAVVTATGAVGGWDNDVSRVTPDSALCHLPFCCNAALICAQRSLLHD